MGGGPPTHRPHVALHVLALTLAFVLALATGAAASARGAAGSAVVGSTTVGTSVRASPGPPTGGALPDPAELRAALLTAHDIGLSPDTTPTSSPGGSETKFTGCTPLSELLNAPSPTTPSAGQNEQEAMFTAGDTGPFVGEALTTEAPAQLAADYAKVAKALTSCRSLTSSSDGIRLTFDVTPIKFGGAGSAGARLDTTYQGVQVNGYIAVQRIGPVVMAYYFFQVGGGSSQLASAYYRQAAEKAAHTLGVR